MALTQDFAVGRSRRCVVVEQSAFGTPVLPSTANSADELAVLSCSMTYEQSRRDRMDARPTRDQLSFITGKKKTSYQLECYAHPITLTAPSNAFSSLLEAAFGVETAGTSPSRMTYTLSDAQNGLKVFSLWDLHNDAQAMQGVHSAGVDEFKFTATGEDEAKVNFSGPAQDYSWTSRAILNGAVATGASTMTLDNADMLSPGSVVQIGDDTNSGNGYLITAVNYTTNVATFSPVLAGAGESDDEAVIPILQSSLTFPTGQPISSTIGALNMTSSTPVAENGIPIVGFEFTLKNNLKVVDQEAFQLVPRDFIPGKREVSGQVTILLTRTQAARIAHRKNSAFEALALTVRVGGTAANDVGMWQFTLPLCEVGFSDIEVPDTEEATFTLPFRCLGSGSGANSVTLTIY